MSSDTRLNKIVRAALEEQGAPDFETSWRQAQRLARAGRTEQPSPWRWVLGPALALGVTASVILILAALGQEPNDLTEGVRMAALADAGAGETLLDDIGVLEIPASPLAGLETMALDGSLFAASDAAEESSAHDAADTSPGSGLYVAGTDFLLTYEIPAWDEAGERSVL